MLVSIAAEPAVTIIGVISVLTLAGFELSIRKWGNHFKFLHLFQLQQNNDKCTAVECPTKKASVTENGIYVWNMLLVHNVMSTPSHGGWPISNKLYFICKSIGWTLLWTPWPWYSCSITLFVYPYVFYISIVNFLD